MDKLFSSPIPDIAANPLLPPPTLLPASYIIFEDYRKIASVWPTSSVWPPLQKNKSEKKHGNTSKKENVNNK